MEKIDKGFISEMDNIDERWNSWEPTSDIEVSLRNRINEME